MLTGFFVAISARRGRPVDLALYAVPMVLLALGTLADIGWVVVVAAVFYSVWLFDQLISWLPMRAVRARRDTAHAVLGVISVAVLAATWCAAAADVPPVA